MLVKRINAGKCIAGPSMPVYRDSFKLLNQMQMTQLLIIDDNPLEHLIMERLLAKLEIFPGAWHSTDAEESFAKLMRSTATETDVPDVIFLDLNMPGFNGWDFLRAFSSISVYRSKSIDIYIYSSSVEPEIRELPDRFPFVRGCLPKPVSTDALLSVHARYLAD